MYRLRTADQRVLAAEASHNIRCPVCRGSWRADGQAPKEVYERPTGFRRGPTPKLEWLTGGEQLPGLLTLPTGRAPPNPCPARSQGGSARWSLTQRPRRFRGLEAKNIENDRTVVRARSDSEDVIRQAEISILRKQRCRRAYTQRPKPTIAGRLTVHLRFHKVARNCRNATPDFENKRQVRQRSPIILFSPKTDLWGPWGLASIHRLAGVLGGS